jgi:hypothetical protein
MIVVMDCNMATWQAFCTECQVRTKEVDVVLFGVGLGCSFVHQHTLKHLQMHWHAH